ncbi:oligogalacturonate-specific porin KdgM family protein [Vibrio astriarenae]
MTTLTKTSIAISALLVSTIATAASLDIREEYRHKAEERHSRIKISGGTGNHFFGLEAKQSGEINERKATDNEVEYGYRFNLDKHWRIQPSMPITFGSNNTTFKPQIRVQYKFDSGLTTQLRYRHEFRVYDDSSNENRDRSKITGNVNYNHNFWQFGFEANYAEDFFGDSWPGSQDNDYEWDYNFKIGYKGKDWNWRPYIELGNINCSSSCDPDSTRQLRSRVGITYSF